MPNRSTTAPLLRALPLLLTVATLACAGATPEPPAPPVPSPPAVTAPAPAPLAATAQPALPPVDTDQDKLADIDDECPNEPETYNGYEDDDGCPDQIPEPPTICFGPPFRSIFFAEGGARLGAEQRELLDKTVELLQRFPDIRVELRGHTDSRGSQAANLEVAQRRVKVVRRYLIARGIAEDRVETRAIGGVEPIATNETREGREKNRRVEFKILER